MIDRRTLILGASAGIALNACRSVSNGPPHTRYEDMIILNSLGFADDGYSAPLDPERRRPLLSNKGIKAALASGVTALNLTIDHGDDYEEAIAAIHRADSFLSAHNDRLQKVTSAADIRRAKAAGKVGIIYGFQNAAMVENRVAHIDEFAALGVRVIQLTYNLQNQIGGGSLASGNPGLSRFGREVVERLNAKNVVIDLSHSGRQTCLDAVEVSRQPICISHTGCRALADVPRNKTDEEMRRVAERGGYIGIYFMPYLAPGRPYDSTDIIRHIDYALKICGEDHVGIGTDHGLVPLGDLKTVRGNYALIVNERRASGISAPGEDPSLLPYPVDLIGPGQFQLLVKKLLAHGYSSGRVEKIMGQNFLRYVEGIWGD